MSFGEKATLLLLTLVVACNAPSWTDTSNGQDTRSTVDSGIVDDSGATELCTGVANSRPPVNGIVVTFPNHGSPNETIHVAVGASSCDLKVDTDTDNVIFVSDASPCAKLLAPGTPSQSTATVSGGSGGPNDLLFQWSYGTECTIADDYTLSK